MRHGVRHLDIEAQRFDLKGKTVNAISRDHRIKELHVRFTTAPLEPLSSSSNEDKEDIVFYIFRYFCYINLQITFLDGKTKMSL